MSDSIDDWDYHIDLNSINNKLLIEFEAEVRNAETNLLKLLDNAFEAQQLNHKHCGNGTANEDDMIKSLIEKNNKMRSEIEKMSKEISQNQIQYEQYKKDQKLLAKEIKEKHEAFLMAKKFYKKNLKMYYTIEQRNCENETVFIQFFTEAKKDLENYSVRLRRNTKTGQYLILKTTPLLSSQDSIQKHLKDLNDVPSALCSIRQAFKDFKKK